jgi:hypothetical protein
MQHQLGVLYRRLHQYAAAETAYRESARIKEGLGDLSWGGGYLFQPGCYHSARRSARPRLKLGIAGPWIDFNKVGRKDVQAKVASNLADLLQEDPDRLERSQGIGRTGLGH